MKSQIGDYLIVGGLTSRKLLVKCVEYDGSKNYVGKVIDSKASPNDKPELVDFSRTDIIANMGKRPVVGSAFGVKIEPLFKSEGDRFFEEVHYFVHQDEEVSAVFQEELKKFRIAVKKKNLVTAKLKPILEVRQRTGKYAGHYRYRPKDDNDLMCVRPGEDMTDMQYVFAHEFGHGVWFRLMTRNHHLNWLKLYHKYISVLSADDKLLRSLLEVVHSTRSISSSFKEIDEYDVPVLRDCVKHVSRVHGIPKHFLDMLLEDGQDISEYWPTSLELSEKEIAVTEYGSKSVEEFFAEAFSFYFIGRSLPKAVQSLLDKTLSTLVK